LPNEKISGLQFGTQITMNILIAPSGFKESLSPEKVADCIEEGILHVLPNAQIIKAPLVDGGEGFTKTLVQLTGGIIYHEIVTGPVGEPVRAHWGVLGGTGPKTVILEIASAAGLRLVPRGMRKPLETTTYGVGELIKAALDTGAQRLLIGCGDSGTNDGGAGMAQALGVRLLDKRGVEIGRGGAELSKLYRIDISGRDRRIDDVVVDVACNWQNVLCGARGVARVFGPQKGASPKIVAELDDALNHFAEVIKRETRIDVRIMPGGGASGGLGAGLHVFLNATLHPRYDIVMQYLDIDSPLDQADLVITGEGCIDRQTPHGKIPGELVRRARSRNLPVITLAGMIGEGADENFVHGMDAYSSILEAPIPMCEAMANAPALLTRAADRVMRLIQVGQQIERADDLRMASDGHGFTKKMLTAEAPVLVTALENSESPVLTELLQELRAPLGIIMGYTGMIQSGQLGGLTGDQDRALRNILKHSQWLLSIVNALFKTFYPNALSTLNDSETAYEDNWATQGPSNGSA
jgi:glycerate kinase